MKTLTTLVSLCAALPLIAAQDIGSTTEPVSGPTVGTLVKELPGGTGGLEVDADGFVYSSDFGSKLGAGSKGGTHIFKVHPKSGKYETFYDKARGASGNAIGPDGKFYQSNIGGNFVTRITPDGEATVFCRAVEARDVPKHAQVALTAARIRNETPGAAGDEAGELTCGNLGGNRHQVHVRCHRTTRQAPLTHASQSETRRTPIPECAFLRPPRSAPLREPGSMPWTAVKVRNAVATAAGCANLVPVRKHPHIKYRLAACSMTSKIVYTLTDEAPALATYSLLPIVQTFTQVAGVAVETRDISLAARILASFPDHLDEKQRVPDALAELGALAGTPEANIVKLPNISASVPQLKAAAAELQASGYKIPDYPDDPQTDAEYATRAAYDKVKGSAVNPVLREGNSDRRAPKAVKEYARKNPHSMGAWSSDSKTHVSTMSGGDFRSNETSTTLQRAGSLRIEHVDADGKVSVLRESVPVLNGEVIDATVMSAKALDEFLCQQIADAKDKGVLFSLHLKATMMKVSDPILFGHAVKAFFPTLFAKHAPALAAAGVNPNNGLGNLIEIVAALPDEQRVPMQDEIEHDLANGPAMAMVNSDKGITNLHVPSDVIIDASMPAMIRTSGQMWNGAGELQDTKAVIPDSSYAAIYAETIDFCREHGAFDPTTMGSVPNVGLMAQKAEEYGSHDKTFELEASGHVRVVDDEGNTLLAHPVEAGDIWRMCQVKDAPIQDWVKLAVSRARATGVPAVFWLDETRAHDAQLLTLVKRYLADHDTGGLELLFMAPAAATRYTLERCKAGQDTISVTGNVLRDFLTDLFPILELGTSAKMLSIVPLMKGGGLFETGAGGSAPKHVQQFNAENHLRWDSLGEFLALAVSLEHLADTTDNARAKLLGQTLDQATGKFLLNGKSPSRKVNELDNRGSHFYLALYWAQALVEQDSDAEMKAAFAGLAETLAADENKIVDELNAVQGQSMDIGGYYFPNPELAAAAMRPSATFNGALAQLGMPSAS
ncbi:MAG: isocitrate dehydrogenase [Planctomycetota bacterium]